MLHHPVPILGCVIVFLHHLTITCEGQRCTPTAARAYLHGELLVTMGREGREGKGGEGTMTWHSLTGETCRLWLRSRQPWAGDVREMS
jgi:hypothetical protein